MKWNLFATEKISVPCRCVVGRIHCIIIFIHRSFKRYPSFRIYGLCLCFASNKTVRQNKCSRCSIRRSFAPVTLGQSACNLLFMLIFIAETNFRQRTVEEATGSAVAAKNRFQCIILIFTFQLEHVDQYMTDN